MPGVTVQITIVCIGALLAYANGANDTFKGVATLLGSATAGYRQALLWAAATTGLGSLSALVLARGLLEAFSGSGLVPAGVAATPAFVGAVSVAAGLTILLATRLGFPISTTHALVGGLVGAGLIASPSGVDIAHLAGTFLLPLLTSPVLAVGLAAGVYPVFSLVRSRLGVSRDTCVCIGQETVAVVPGAPGREAVLRAVSLPTLAVGTRLRCEVRYRGSLLGLRAGPALDVAHYLSAGAVSFARGVNDTPKIAAILLVGTMLSPAASIIGVGMVMAIGGLLGARRVAETLSYRVTDMNPGQGFTANLVTAALVIGASRFGLPVSTTHVSCGALFGIGSATRQAHWGTITSIVLAWVVTLPLAGLLGAGFAQLFARLG